jgi:hypothetical protein
MSCGNANINYVYCEILKLILQNVIRFFIALYIEERFTATWRACEHKLALAGGNSCKHFVLVCVMNVITSFSSGINIWIS